jgi:hypothetical protein
MKHVLECVKLILNKPDIQEVTIKKIGKSKVELWSSGFYFGRHTVDYDGAYKVDYDDTKGRFK